MARDHVRAELVNVVCRHRKDSAPNADIHPSLRLRSRRTHRRSQKGDPCTQIRDGFCACGMCTLGRVGAVGAIVSRVSSGVGDPLRLVKNKRMTNPRFLPIPRSPWKLPPSDKDTHASPRVSLRDPGGTPDGSSGKRR